LHKQKETAENTAAIPVLSPLINAQQEILAFERELLIQLYKNAVYNDAVIREVERELDIEAMRLNQLMPEDADKNK
jgi:CPA1 family monovalent cation:H+ antiporter